MTPSPDPNAPAAPEPTTGCLRLTDIRIFRLACSELLSGRGGSFRGIARALRADDPDCGVSEAGIREAERRLRSHFQLGDHERLFRFDAADRLDGLTPVGDGVHTLCIRVLATLEARPPAVERGHHMVATAGSVLHDVVPDAVDSAEVRLLRPETILFDTFVPGRVAEQLADGRVDMGVAWHGGTGEVPASAGLANATWLDAEAVSDPVGVCVLVSAGHPLACRGATPMQVGDLADQTIVYPPLLPIRRTARSVPNARRVRVADFPAVARQVASGLGVGLYPNHPVHTRPACRQYGLRAIPLDVPTRLQLCTYARRGTALPPVIEALRTAMREVVAEAARETRWQADHTVALDRLDWVGEWTLWVGAGRHTFRPLRAIVGDSLELRLEGEAGPTAYTGVVSRYAAGFCRVGGPGHAALSFTHAARHPDRGLALLGTGVQPPGHPGPLTQPVVLSRGALRPSDPYWIADRLLG
jgi:hypothetical protein